MTTKEAIEIIESNKAGSYLLTKAIQHVTQVAKRFEGAVEVEYAMDEKGYWGFEKVQNQQALDFEFKLYAIPKENK